MANVDSPRGFTPIGHMCGCEVVAHEYIVTTGTTIYKGDPVIAVAAGTVTVGAAAASTANLGIAAEYVSDSGSAGGKKIRIYDDPNILYMVQMTTGITASMANCVFGSSDIVTYAAGNATTGLSIMELDTPGTSSLPWIILGLYPSVDNAWGEHAKVICKYNAHIFVAVYAGLA